MSQVESQWGAPRSDVLSGKEGVTVFVDLPGVVESDVELSVEREILTISATPSFAFREEAPLRHEEFRLEPLRRRINLAEGLDVERIRAELKDGVLKVTIPARAEVGPRKIAVNAA
jgi:HSP20 family molecular chaperone IbpA